MRYTAVKKKEKKDRTPYIQKIFITIPEKREPQNKDALAIELDQMLSRLFDDAES